MFSTNHLKLRSSFVNPLENHGVEVVSIKVYLEFEHSSLSTLGSCYPGLFADYAVRAGTYLLRRKSTGLTLVAKYLHYSTYFITDNLRLRNFAMESQVSKDILALCGPTGRPLSKSLID